MMLLFAFLAVIVGLSLLTYGADRLIIGACVLARRAKVSEAVVGATIVAGGTSLPELVASLVSALDNQFGLSVGNVVGSNIFNIGAILGPVALIAPLVVAKMIARFDWWVMAVITFIFCVIAVLFGSLSSWFCGGFFIAWLFYIAWSVRSGHGAEEATLERPESMALPLAFLWIVAGIALLAGGGYLLVWGAVRLAQAAGVSDAIIGLTIVAAGTSMPELVTSLLAARRGQHQIAVANIVGSNTFNLMLVIGVTGLFGRLPIAEEILHRDIWWMMGFALLLPFLWGRKLVLSRLAGGILLGGYLVYLGILIRSAVR